MPELRITASRDGVSRASDWLRDRCADAAVPDEVRSDLELALDEALSNVLRHGYGSGAPGEILVLLVFLPGTIRLELRDRAHAYNPLDAPEPDLDADPDRRPVGGLGVHLLRRVMDRVAYVRENGENRLTLERRAT